MVYLDNAATSFPKAPGVAAAMAEYVEKVGATINRSSYAAAQEAGLVTLTLRERLCRLFDHPDPTHAVITAGDSVAEPAIKGLLRPGDHCVKSYGAQRRHAPAGAARARGREL
ncbi:MAG: aminotransferase class V-fold PLP-dependent enzyme [Oscillospiraceae bacterium]